MDVEIEIAFTLRNEIDQRADRQRHGVARRPRRHAAAGGEGREPAAGRRERRTGTVVLDVVLLEDGTPRIVRILRSLGT